MAMLATLSPWEVVLFMGAVLLLLLLSISFLLSLIVGLTKAKDERAKAAQQASDDLQVDDSTVSAVWEVTMLWAAQGFAVGRIPFAPGTFGSLLGLLWFGVLLSTQNIWGFVGGMIGGVLAAVWICGRAEAILKERDPGSIVLDEICAMPICFVPWVVSELSRQKTWPALETFFGAKTWYLTALIFILFRIFDILKPPPVRQSQRLPGGWGVVTDDVLAALYVCALSLIVFH
jgi:phosphatidylglycerophosphatase A